MTINRIAVLGTGANGSGVAADLVRAGLDVTLIEQWPAHVEAMRAGGLTVNMPDESVTTVVNVLHLCEVATIREKFDLVFTLVKAYDTRWAMELIKPVLADDGLVVGLQNGMSIDDIASIVGPERTIGAVIEMASNMFTPGEVNRQNPPSEAWFGLGAFDESTRDRVAEVAGILSHAGTVEIYDDIRSAKWMKLIVNAGELVPSAIIDLPLSEAIRVAGMHEFMLEACVEAAETAVAAGNTLMPIFGLKDMDFSSTRAFVTGLLDAVLDTFSLPDTRTTVLQDWMKGRRSEVSEVNGLVVELGALHGVATPTNSITVDIARRIESGELENAPENAPLLVGVLAAS